MLWACRPESKALRACLEKAYNDEAFREECTNQYLDRRAEYRRTGIIKESRRKFGPKVHISPSVSQEEGTPAA